MGKENKSWSEKKKVKREVEHENTASSPYQDLHPNWDRFRGTMLYPLSWLRSARNKCKDSDKKVF